MDSDRPMAPPPSTPRHAPWPGAAPVQAKPLRVPAWIVTALLGGCALIGVWSLYVGALLYGFAQDLDGGWSEALGDRAASIDSMGVAVMVSHITLLLGTAAAFIVWFHRCRFNAGVFQPNANRMSQGWSIGAWFIPVGNLWLPKKVANDIWRAAPPSGEQPARPPARTVLNLWWTLWVTYAVLDRVASKMYEHADDLEEISSAAVAGICVDVLYVAAAGAAAAYVWRLTRLQEARTAQWLNWSPYTDGPRG